MNNKEVGQNLEKLAPILESILDQIKNIDVFEKLSYPHGYSSEETGEMECLEDECKQLIEHKTFIR